MFTKNCGLWFGVMALAVVYCGTAQAAPIVISDGTFNSANWTTQLVDQDDASTGTVTQMTSGGNPGYFQQLQVDLVAAYAVPPEYWPPISIASDLSIVCIYDAASYDPGVSGAIESLTFSVYTKDVNTDLSQHCTIGWIVYQSDNVYAGGPPWDTQGDTYWTLHPGTHFSSSDFNTFDGSHPDFSAAGAPITFGYVALALNADTSASHIHTVGVDNWRVDVTPVPEPATLSLLTLGGLMVGLRRRR